MARTRCRAAFTPPSDTAAAGSGDPSQNERELRHVVCALQGFFRSITLGSTDSIQDLLRLLTLWFRYGHELKVEAAERAAEVAEAVAAEAEERANGLAAPIGLLLRELNACLAGRGMDEASREGGTWLVDCLVGWVVGRLGGGRG